MNNIYSDNRGYPRWKDSHKLVHRTVAQNMVGGHIFPNRVVHHIDGIKSNFRKTNLVIMTREDHDTLHKLQQKYFSRFFLN